MTIFLSRISMNLYELIYIFKKIFKHLFISLYRVLVAHGLFVWLQFSSVHSLSCARLFATPWTAAHQASLSITPSWSFLKLMSIVSVMPSNHLILCPLLLLPSIFPSIRSFPVSQFFTSGGQSTGASASASVLPMNIQD